MCCESLGVQDRPSRSTPPAPVRTAAEGEQALAAVALPAVAPAAAAPIPAPASSSPPASVEGSFGRGSSRPGSCHCGDQLAANSAAFYPSRRRFSSASRARIAPPQPGEPHIPQPLSPLRAPPWPPRLAVQQPLWQLSSPLGHRGLRPPPATGSALPSWRPRAAVAKADHKDCQSRNPLAFL